MNPLDPEVEAFLWLALGGIVNLLLKIHPPSALKDRIDAAAIALADKAADAAEAAKFGSE